MSGTRFHSLIVRNLPRCWVVVMLGFHCSLDNLPHRAMHCVGAEALVLPTVFAICSRRQSDCSRHGTMPGNVGTRLPSLKWSLCNYDGPIAVIETWHCVPSGLMPCLPHLADICQFVRLASCLSRQQFFRSTNGYPSSLVLPIRFRLVTNSVRTEPGLPLLVSVRRSQRLV